MQGGVSLTNCGPVVDENGGAAGHGGPRVGSTAGGMDTRITEPQGGHVVDEDIR